MTVTHARLRHGARDAAPAVRGRRRRRARRLVAEPHVPRRRSAASASSAATQLPRRARHPRPRRHAARAGPGPHVAARRDVAAAIVGELGPRAGRARRRAARARLPRRRAGRHLGPRARLRRAARRARPAASCAPGTRVLAPSTPRPATAVRSSIDPDVQRAAVDGLGERFGGVAVVRPRTGEILGARRASRSRACSRRARRSRSITLAGVLRGAPRRAELDVSRRRRRRRSRASSSRTPTASRAAARCASPSRTPATRSSRRSARAWARSGS